MNGTRVPSAAEQPRFLNGIVEGRDLFLLYRDARDQRMARRVPAEWSSFVRRRDVPAELLRELKASEFVAGVREEGEFYRICWTSDEWRRKAHARDGFFHSLGIETFEADIDPIRRFFSETGALVGTPRRVYLDIETDSRVQPAVARQGKARVLCWSLAVDGGCRLSAGPNPRFAAAPMTVARGVLSADTDEAERRLLELLFEALEWFDQVAAWFGDLFDFPVVTLRAQRVGARIRDPRRWLWIDFAEVYDRMNKPAAESGDEKTSRSLGFVAQEVLGEGKDDFDARKTWEAWEAGGAERERMAAYCDKDALLLPKLEAATGYLALNASVCEVCRVFSDTDSATPSTFVDGWLLRVGVERGIRFPNRPWSFPDADRKKFAGAWVLEPQVRGIRKNVHVVDFSGMYPSIIQTWNMSPETLDPMVPVNGPVPPGRARAPATGVGFRQDVVGLLSGAVAEMKGRRKHFTKLQASLPPGSPEWVAAGRLSAAYKVVVNIFYGIAGSPHSRFSDVRVAESVSTTGVWLIQKTLHASEGRGMFAIYSDTDSAFFEKRAGAPELTFAGLEEFVRSCNVDLYPEAVRGVGCAQNFIELAYEKCFERLVLVSKKNYAAVYAFYKGTATCSCDAERDGKVGPGRVDVRTMTCRDCGKVWDAIPPARGKPEIRGLEYRRGDTNRIARRLQKQVIDLLMLERSEDPAAFVPLIEAMRCHVLEDPLPVDDVSNAQSLTKSLREYDKAKKQRPDGKEPADSAHVQVAKILRGRGEQMVEGVKVPYVVVDGHVSPMRVIPAVDYAGECDRYYLWEKRIYPATQRVLEAAFPAEPGLGVEELRLRDWARFLRVRPKADRRRKPNAFELAPDGTRVPSGKARPAPEGQGDLFAAPPVAQAAPAPADGPFLVEVLGSLRARLPAVKAVLLAHPGPRRVELRILGPGGEVVAAHQTDVAVADSPELRRAVANAIAGSTPAA